MIDSVPPGPPSIPTDLEAMTLFHVIPLETDSERQDFMVNALGRYRDAKTAQGIVLFQEASDFANSRRAQRACLFRGVNRITAQLSPKARQPFESSTAKAVDPAERKMAAVNQAWIEAVNPSMDPVVLTLEWPRIKEDAASELGIMDYDGSEGQLYAAFATKLRAELEQLLSRLGYQKAL
jgi:hypothetical protein